MASYYRHAGDAIGQTVQKWHPRDAHNWGNIVPANDWGMDRPLWDQMLQDILDKFLNLIAPAKIRHGSRFDGARIEELYILQRRLSDSVAGNDE